MLYSYDPSLIRHLQLSTPHGVLQTPFFMPIATRGVVKGLVGEEIKNLGAQIVLGNTYHLWLKPGLEVIKGTKGLHNFMNWSGPILTDSGGFQVFSLGKFRQISDKGVVFSEPASGQKYFLTPQKSIEIQLKLGSDIIMVLDECPPWPSSKKDVITAVKRTTKWAEICRKYFDNKMSVVVETPYRASLPRRPLLFGIIQGGVHSDLRQKSAEELLRIGFDGYAIGGVAVGEPRKYLNKVLKATLPTLPIEKPRYLMGLGRPEEIITAVCSGIDMFDCVIPTREGRHGRLFIREKKYAWLGKKKKFDFRSKEIYSAINIGREEYKKDFRPVDPHCDCYLCQNFSRAYLHHLFKIGDTLALRLASIHNLKFYLDLIKSL